MVPVSSEYKISTIAYKSAFNAFPKNTWVTFKVAIDWAVYNGAGNKMQQTGKLDIVIQYQSSKKKVNNHIFNNQTIAVGESTIMVIILNLAFTV